MENNENRKHLESIREELEKVYNGELLNEDGEPVSFWEYFDDVLDINYTVNADKTYKGVRLLIAFGGPNIYIDTMDQEIQLYWWSDTEKIWLPSEICNEIDSVFEEYYNC